VPALYNKHSQKRLKDQMKAMVYFEKSADAAIADYQ